MSSESLREIASGKRRGSVAALGVALALVLCGCGRYPVVSSGEHIELLAALRTACSSRRSDRLDRTVEAIEERRAASEMQDAEYEAFQEIIAMARAGKWKEAEMETYRYQSAQVR